MCGIFSILNYDTRKLKLLNKEFMKGVGRGPEKSSIYTDDDNKFMLGFHRLAINGYNDYKSNQPFYINGVILICNGEIYNWKELYNYLKMDKRHSNSDCEIIIHLYKLYGIEQTLQMLDGVFAFALYDENIKTMYFARDTYGVRPMFVGEHLIHKNGTDHIQYLFASELKQLVDIHKDFVEFKQFKPGTYSKYILDNNIHPRMKNEKTKPCFFRKIFDERHFSSPNSFTNLSINTFDKARDTVRLNFMDAVRKRVDNTEREIACLLSGGLDSSLVVSLVNKFMNNLGDNTRLHTWSIGLKGSDDLRYAKIVADYLHTIHHEIIVTEDEMLDAIKEVIYTIESYDTTSVRASIGNWLISKYIKNNSEAKVIFNGDGSDELTGGYMYFHCAPDKISFDKECRRLLKNIHYFDVLRSDRSISSHGLEARTPFLDRNFVQTYLSIPIKYRNMSGKCEKYLLRSAFDNMDVLPREILWRTKEAFSDGISSQKESWFEVLQRYIKDIYRKESKYSGTDEDIINGFIQLYNWKINLPKTLEQLHYRIIFEQKFPGQEKVIPYYWMPNFVNATDASARTLEVYMDKMKKNE